MNRCDEGGRLSIEFAVEQDILVRSLAAHPTQLAIEELAAATADRLGASATLDEVDSAVLSLVAAGLLRRDGDFVSATRAAVRSDELSP